MQLTTCRDQCRRGALRAGCVALLLPGCFDGRLDTFEVTGESGGRAGAGGVGGSSGASGNGGSLSQTGPLLIDDFEDQDKNAPPDGWWYPKDDGTGPPATMTFDPVADRGDSRFAAHFAAGPTTGYGSFLGLDLPGGLFDATGFVSLSFWARLEPAGALSVRFQNPEATQFQQVRELDGTWREIRLPLADFIPSDEDGAPIDLSQLTHLQLWLPDTRPAFHLYVDDVSLLREP